MKSFSRGTFRASLRRSRNSKAQTPLTVADGLRLFDIAFDAGFDARIRGLTKDEAKRIALLKGAAYVRGELIEPKGI